MRKLLTVVLAGLSLAVLGDNSKFLIPGVVEIPADFTQAKPPDRANVDLKVSCDLRIAQGIEFDVYCEDISEFSRCSCYFQSGNGWYCSSFSVEESGKWQHVIVHKAKCSIEGKPAGWTKISCIRISGWRAGKGNTRFMVSNLAVAGGDPEVVIAAKRDQAVKRAAEISQWMASRPSRAGEHRAFWCHNARGLGGDKSWDDSIRILKENGFNTIIPNLCWGGVAFYDSKVLPVAKSVATEGDAFDACLAACRKYGVKMHVWKVCWNMGGCANKEFAEKMKAEGRTQIELDGHAQDKWLCPSHPENQQLEIEAMVELAKKGPDGIHFDYIRYPNDKCCFCAGCRERFEAKLARKVDAWPADVYGKTAKLNREWNEFRRENITKVVRTVSERVRKECPGVEISAALFNSPSSDPNTIAQDWPNWCRKGYLDFACNMNYIDSAALFRGQVKSQIAAVGKNFRLYPGLGLSCWQNDGEDGVKMVKQIEVVRELGLKGFTVFNFDRRAEKVLPLLRKGVTRSVTPEKLVVKPLEGEKWWGGVTLFGSQQPYLNCGRWDLASRNYLNPCAPLFVSNKGRYLWSERPFGFKFAKGVLTVDYTEGRPQVVVAGKTLKEAYLAASREHFPPTGTLPDELFFTRPQFNTWIESNLVDNNQRMVENYIDSIVSNRFPCGVFMLDAGWATTDGDFAFNGRFPDPKKLFSHARAAGMRTLIWTVPYVNSNAKFFKEGVERNLFMRHPDGSVYAGYYWPSSHNFGVMNLFDTATWEPFKARYRKFMNDYGFDGYKFDFTDAECLNYRDKHTNAAAPLPPGKVNVDYTEAWEHFAASFKFNELRAGWKAGGLPLVYRLQDKNHSWNDLRKLIPDMLAAGLLGCAYTCPDMIGGGGGGVFREIREGKKKLDVRLFVRSAQVQALMPMMQFSAAPWRLLKGDDLEACRAAANLHVEFAPLIVKLAHESSHTGEPIVRTMEYEFPNQGFDACLQQFMLGSEWLVAPVTQPDDSVEVRLPAGSWKDDLGETHVGPKTLKLEKVPIGRIPRFHRLNASTGI